MASKNMTRTPRFGERGQPCIEGSTSSAQQQTTFDAAGVSISPQQYDCTVHAISATSSSSLSSSDDGGNSPASPASTYRNGGDRQQLKKTNTRSTLSTASTSSIFTRGTQEYVEEEEEEEPPSCGSRWNGFVLMLQEPLKRLLVSMAVNAARWPKLYLTFMLAASLALAYVGYTTNFRIENRESELWSPTGSRPQRHKIWVDQVFLGRGDDRRRLFSNDVAGDFESQKFPSWWEEGEDRLGSLMFDASLSQSTPSSSSNSDRQLEEVIHVGSSYIAILVHAQGSNVVTKEGAERNFQALDRVRSISGYKEFCAEYGSPPCPPKINEFVCWLYGIPVEENATKVCNVAGVTGLWFNNHTIFESRVETDLDVQKTMAIDVFPGREDEYDLTNYIGYPEYDTINGTDLLVSGKSYLTGIRFPTASMSKTLAERMVAAVFELQDEWESDPDNIFRVEVVNGGAFESEVIRGITADLPLIPTVFALMSCFTALVFLKFDWRQSQCILGVGAVACVTLSLFTGFGIMFWIGYPFTSLTLALVFIVFGIGLDDAFILYSSYVRTSPSKSAVDRVRDTMNDVAISIFMTTATTQVALGLGCLSQVPAIRWLCVSWDGGSMRIIATTNTTLTPLFAILRQSDLCICDCGHRFYLPDNFLYRSARHRRHQNQRRAKRLRCLFQS